MKIFDLPQTEAFVMLFVIYINKHFQYDISKIEKCAPIIDKYLEFLQILQNIVKKVVAGQFDKSLFHSLDQYSIMLLPARADFVIIGGGLTGSSTAYWLRERFRDEGL